MSKNERSRLSSTVHQLHSEGKLTKDPTRERLHVGAFLVRKLATAFLDEALRQGTVNWDVTLAKTLSIVLVAALGSRTGDVTVAPLDTNDLPFLCYQDITLKLSKDGHLTAQVLLRNEKGDK